MRENQERLWRAMVNVLIRLVATDGMAPQSRDEVCWFCLEYPCLSGCPWVEAVALVKKWKAEAGE